MYLKKGHIDMLKGQKMTEEQKRKIGNANRGRIKSEDTLKKMSVAMTGKMAGKNSPHWKHGLRHTKEYIRLHNKKNNAIKKYGGVLAIETIQLVYEDNIKKYGTLTCYLCEDPIEFGKDELEHKTPANKGGTNNYDNLAISCRLCNSLKYNRTEQEYKESLNKEVATADDNHTKRIRND